MQTIFKIKNGNDRNPTQWREVIADALILKVPTLKIRYGNHNVVLVSVDRKFTIKTEAGIPTVVEWKEYRKRS